MGTHSRKINFALPAVLDEQQAQQMRPHPHKIDLIFGIVPNPFLKNFLSFTPYIGNPKQAEKTTPPTNFFKNIYCFSI